MPGRKSPLVTNEFFHVFNRGIDHRPTFLNKRYFTRAQQSINYYRFAKQSLRLARFLELKGATRQKIITNLNRGELQVEIISYCLMPNHFHLLLRQKLEMGISKFMSNFQNSYTRYFNSKNNRTGPLFLDQFRAVRIETEEQLLHVHRYIHLNPYTSYVVKTLDLLTTYPWSSLPEYLGKSEGFSEKQFILDHFKTASTYKAFIFDQADYQRRLEAIKHLTFED